jgi:hypothetical protein
MKFLIIWILILSAPNLLRAEVHEKDEVLDFQDPAHCLDNKVFPCHFKSLQKDFQLKSDETELRFLFRSVGCLKKKTELQLIEGAVRLDIPKSFIFVSEYGEAQFEKGVYFIERDSKSFIKIYVIEGFVSVSVDKMDPKKLTSGFKIEMGPVTEEGKTFLSEIEPWATQPLLKIWKLISFNFSKKALQTELKTIKKNNQIAISQAQEYYKIVIEQELLRQKKEEEAKQQALRHKEAERKEMKKLFKKKLFSEELLPPEVPVISNLNERLENLDDRSDAE